LSTVGPTTEVADGEATPPRVVVVIVDGLPSQLATEVLPELPFLGKRLPYRATAVSCFPSTTGPAYFPFLTGCTPGRANVPGIRWLDRTHPTQSAFPHRGLRSYVGPDARRLATDTKATTLFARHAWPVSTPIPKDLPKRGELSRDLVWTVAHFTHRWDQADRRTSWKLGRALRKGREIVFAVFPSVDELGHTFGIASGRPQRALEEIDRQLYRKLGDFDGSILLSADHGLTDTHAHLDLRGIVEGYVGTTIAFPVISKRFPEAVVCESGNGMANVYLNGRDGWTSVPSPDRCRELAAQLLTIEGVESVALRGESPNSAELWTRSGVGEVRFDESGLHQSGAAFDVAFERATPGEALVHSGNDRNPDAAFALTSLFASERTGDLLVSAEPGYDLRTASEWPEHHASHGALHREHTVVPVFSSTPLPDRPLRTLDLFSLTLELAGIPLDEYTDSDASALARGSWRPEVWR
jgi:Type I phosphodiesterase / nucleotide pyrophosphatase